LTHILFFALLCSIQTGKNAKGTLIIEVMQKQAFKTINPIKRAIKAALPPKLIVFSKKS
jgi:hypothetical protein